MVTKIDASMFDAQGKEIILDADADTSITADTDNQIDIKIAGADDFSFKANTFEVQTGSNIDMNGTELILDANGNTSITADTDDQIDIKIAGADDFQFTANTFTVLSGSTLAVASGATIANSGTATGFGFASGDVILADDGSAGAPGLAFADDTDHGFFRTSDKLGYSVGGSERIRFDGKLIFVGDTANANNSIGMTLNQDTSDDEIFALKSSDVAHGMTDETETDTFGLMEKEGAAGGGLRIQGATEGTVGMQLAANVVSVNTTKGSSGRASNEVRTYLKSGTAVGNTGANANMFLVSADGDVAGFIVDSDGDVHIDGSQSAFDEYDDALMLRTFMHEQTPDGVIKTEFDKFLKYNKKSLEESGIIGTIDPDDPDCYHADGTLSRPLICLTQLQRLEVGAIVQQRAMFETMKSVVEEMLPGFSKKLNERLEAQSLPALPV